MAGTPQEVAAAWVQGLSSKTDKITRGIQSVTVAPGQAAARQKSVWAANTAAAVDRFATNVGKVSLSDWQTAAINKGVPRIATGASNAQQKMEAVLTQLLPHIEATRRALPARGTYEQNKARMNAMVDGMHAFKMR